MGKVAFAVLILLAGMAGQAEAAMIPYNITFDGGGTVPTAGSFEYDATVPLFANFFVTWNGVTFDFTSTANGAWDYCGAGTGPSALFTGLSGAGLGVCTSKEWLAETGAGGSFFHFSFFNPDPPFDIAQLTVTLPPTSPEDGNFADFSISEAIPEPSTVTLVGPLMLLAAGYGPVSAWIRRRRGSRRPTPAR